MERIAILGPGGVGGFIAAAFERAGMPVTLVAREETAAALARDGLRVRSVRLGGRFTASPDIATRLEGEWDALIVATKAVGLEQALARADGAEPRVVLPLLNGLDHLGILRERFGTRAVAGSIRIESTRPRTGVIEQTSGFLRVDMASADTAMVPAMTGLAASLERASVPARVVDSEADAMWGKLVRLNALACATSAYDLPVGPILTDPDKRADLEGCVREAAAVATAEGASTDPDAVMEEIAAVHPELRTSMQRDIAAGRPPELDAIPGSVLRAAARHGLGAPTIERLAALAAHRAGVPAPRATP